MRTKQIQEPNMSNYLLRHRSHLFTRCCHNQQYVDCNKRTRKNDPYKAAQNASSHSDKDKIQKKNATRVRRKGHSKSHNLIDKKESANCECDRTAEFHFEDDTESNQSWNRQEKRKRS